MPTLADLFAFSRWNPRPTTTYVGPGPAGGGRHSTLSDLGPPTNRFSTDYPGKGFTSLGPGGRQFALLAKTGREQNRLDLDQSITNEEIRRENERDRLRFEAKYPWLAGLDPSLRPFVLSTIQSQEEEERKQQAALESGINTLGGSRSTFADLLAQYQGDPVRANLTSRLTELAAPDARLIPIEVEQQAIGDIARAGTRRYDDLLAAAADRGQALAPGTALDLNALNAQIEGEAGRTRADIAGRNEFGRRSALEALDRFSNASYQLENQLTSALSRVDAEIAALQAGQEFIPTDYTAFAELDFGQQAYADAQRFAQEALSGAEQAQQFDILDLLPFLFGLRGSGLFG